MTIKLCQNIWPRCSVLAWCKLVVCERVICLSLFSFHKMQTATVQPHLQAFANAIFCLSSSFCDKSHKWIILLQISLKTLPTMWNICRKTLMANFLDNNEINRRYTERMHTYIHTCIHTNTLTHEHWIPNDLMF